MKYILVTLTYILILIPNAYGRQSSVSISVDGQGTFLVPCDIASVNGQCILDTGSRVSEVSDIAATHSLPSAGTIDIHSVGQALQLPLVDVGIFSVGNVLNQPHALIAITNNYFQLPQYLAVIGGPQVVGQDLIFKFSSPAMLSRLTDLDRKKIKKTGKLFPAVGDKRRLELEVSMGTQPVHAMWDTHSSSAFSAQFVAAHADLFEAKTAVQTSDVTGSTSTTPIFRTLKPICMAGSCIDVGDIFTIDQSIMGDFGNGPIEMILGSEVMDQSIWIFDYTNNRYSFQPHH